MRWPISSPRTWTRRWKRRRSCSRRSTLKTASARCLKLLTRQLEILKMRERINSQIKEEMGKNQREYVLRQQLKAIKEEPSARTKATRAIRRHRGSGLRRRRCRQEAEQVAKKQLKRLRNMQVGSAEYTVVRTYLDWILDLPWHMQTPDNMDIGAVRKVLDEDHYGLEKVKKRILEYSRGAKAEEATRRGRSCPSGRPASARRRSVGASPGPWAVSSCVYPSGAYTTRRPHPRAPEDVRGCALRSESSRG